MRHYASFIFALFCIAALTSQVRADAPKKPNILFILADDLGLDGVSGCGSDKHKTPNIDALAKSGTRFETCYAAPLCGPSRCLFLTGQYAFHTGGLQNGSWRANGPGPRGAQSLCVAKTLKSAGYATGQSGKWRQVGDMPSDWGFDEYLTDHTAGGYYWEKVYFKNGQTMQLPAESYQPDIEQAFTVDFITRHKDQPFFFYYAMHLVHKPTVITPDSQKSAEAEAKARHNNNQAFYDDNIGYMDKQVGEIVALLEKLGLREKTLVLFSGDNGTAVGYGSSLNGRQINGSKGSMLEGGSRVPLIASLPGVVAAGKVSKDIVSFADLHPTFAEIGGAPLAQGKVDGISFAPQLLGQPGQPRQWAYVQLGPRWFVREQNWKMNQAGELFDMTDAPYVEKPVPATSQTPDAAAARMRLKAVLDSLKPGSGKVETNANGAPARRRNRNAKT